MNPTLPHPGKGVLRFAPAVLAAVVLIDASPVQAGGRAEADDPAFGYTLGADGKQDLHSVGLSFTVAGRPLRRLQFTIGRNIGPVVGGQAPGASRCSFGQDANRASMTCEYDTPLPEGTRVRLVQRYLAEVPGRIGAFVYINGGAAFAVDGPRRGGEADVHTLLSRDLSGTTLELAQRRGLRPDAALLVVVLEVRNNGPDVATDTRGTFSTGLPNPWFLSEGRVLTGARACRFGRVEFSFDCGNLAPGVRGVSRYGFEVSRPGEFIVTANATSLTPDPGPLPNTASLEVKVVAVPDSKILRVLTQGRGVFARAGSVPPGPTIRGTARNASAVYVAIARRRQGAQVQTAAAGCAWVRNRRGAVRQERGRRCDDPIWLRARGTRRWSLRLSRALPAGSYTLLTRAVTGGVTEASFTRRDGNRREFRVRPRR
jgi:hypothetical protein